MTVTSVAVVVFYLFWVVCRCGVGGGFAAVGSPRSGDPVLRRDVAGELDLRVSARGSGHSVPGRDVRRSVRGGRSPVGAAVGGCHGDGPATFGGLVGS